MRARTYRVVVAAAALLVALAGASATAGASISSGDADLHRELASARHATAGYHRAATAVEDGFALLPDGTPLHECIDEDVDLDDTDRKPAMGLHFVNADRLDGVIAANAPEVLVYEPTRNGRLRLVALEYVVFESAWGSPEAVAPPELFGQQFMYVPDGNRYQLPAFYALHAWLWRHNPAGRLSDFNPLVTCAYAP